MFEELLVCLGEIYAGVEQKITEMNALKAENEAVKAENASLREEIANHVCECDHEEELAQAVYKKGNGEGSLTTKSGEEIMGTIDDSAMRE